MAKQKKQISFDFESYIREGEPDKKEKSIAWSIATDLQQVDGLTPSAYLYETAKRNIEGEISIINCFQFTNGFSKVYFIKLRPENFVITTLQKKNGF